MRECRTSGSVRGVPSNGHPYRNRRACHLADSRSQRAVSVDLLIAQIEPSVTAATHNKLEGGRPCCSV